MTGSWYPNIYLMPQNKNGASAFGYNRNVSPSSSTKPQKHERPHTPPAWALFYQLLTTEASLRPDAQELQRTETLSSTQAERNSQGGNCILTTPCRVHFHISIPLSYAFESQESMGASCRLCRCLFDAFTADVLKWIPMSQENLRR